MSTDNTNRSTDLPWLFSATAQQLPNAMALARAGGRNGQVYTYIDDAALGSGFEAGGGSPPVPVGADTSGSSGNNNGYGCRDNGTGSGSSSHTKALGIGHRPAYHGHHSAYLPPSPPSSVSPPTTAVHIPRPAVSSHILPPSPSASFSNAGHNLMKNVSAADQAALSQSPESRCGPVLPLITSVFPYAASTVAAAAHMLEIVTPPDNVLKGFIVDEDSLGRCVFVHLKPTLSAPAPERLAPHFSDVLRPHDPRRDHPVPPLRQAPTPLDMRESLTALLDLADTLEATQLLLVLDKDERETARLAELMHSLMYVGGIPVQPGRPVGEWDWDWRRWALVSIEL